MEIPPNGKHWCYPNILCYVYIYIYVCFFSGKQFSNLKVIAIPENSYKITTLEGRSSEVVLQRMYMNMS